jgi:hypothetical protein
MDEGEFAFHAPEPVFVLPKDADWAVFGEELSDEIMWLSNRASNLAYALDSLDLASADYDRFFERRQQGYADLARRALDLIDRLLGEFDLHLPAKPDYYHQREGFAAILKTSGTSNPHMKKVALMSNGSNITQLFPKTGEEPE